MQEAKGPDESRSFGGEVGYPRAEIQRTGKNVDIIIAGNGITYPFKTIDEARKTYLLLEMLGNRLCPEEPQQPKECSNCKGVGYFSSRGGMFKEPCPRCWGTKEEPKCKKCKGIGEIIEVPASRYSGARGRIPCPDCSKETPTVKEPQVHSSMKMPLPEEDSQPSLDEILYQIALAEYPFPEGSSVLFAAKKLTPTGKAFKREINALFQSRLESLREELVEKEARKDNPHLSPGLIYAQVVIDHAIDKAKGKDGK